MSQKILIVGNNNPYSLENAFRLAAIDCDFSCEIFDVELKERNVIKFGILGKVLYRFFAIESWVRRMNRDLIMSVVKGEFDVVVVFTSVNILAGSLMTIKIQCEKTKLLWYWADSPAHFTSYNLNSGKLYDFILTYSNASVSLMRRYFGVPVVWIPLAFDSNQCSKDQERRFDVDISFVGTYRPEREQIMLEICKNFSSLKIEILGPGWTKFCKSEIVKLSIKGDGLYGLDMYNYFRRTKINMNIIDDTNYPSANMRFFELGGSGSLQLCSFCPEMQTEFRDFEQVLYYKNPEDLLCKINWAINNSNACNLIANNAYDLVKEKHTYISRIIEIGKILKSS